MEREKENNLVGSKAKYITYSTLRDFSSLTSFPESTSSLMRTNTSLSFLS